MIVHNEPLFQIFFGNRRHQYIPEDYKHLSHAQKLFEHDPFKKAARVLACRSMTFLHQVHGDSGTTINSIEEANSLQPFTQDGDYLLTNKPGVGLGVTTGDCLPIIMYDPTSRALANVHAGWRGTVQEVAGKAVEDLEKTYNSRIDTLKFYFGPCAKVCCYEVRSDVIEKLEQFSFIDEVLHTVAGKTYFNVPLCTVKLLGQYGIKKSAINLQYNDCTMCNETFCSNRARVDSNYRQMTIAVLK